MFKAFSPLAIMAAISVSQVATQSCELGSQISPGLRHALSAVQPEIYKR
jgi:hypothetical protein